METQLPDFSLLYAVEARVTETAKDGWQSNYGLPTFYLDARVQGIVDVAHAERIARNILQARGRELHLIVYPVER
jgi:hypothetical protein